MRCCLAGMLLCANVLASPAAGPQQAQGFADLPRQRVELKGCTFELPMRKGFQIRPAEDDAPPQAVNFYGKLIAGKTVRIDETRITFACYDSNKPDALRGYCIKPADGGWVQAENEPGRDGCDEGPYVKHVALRGSNWVGLGALERRTAVPEEEQAWSLTICLIKEPSVLCANTSDLQYEVRPKENALPFVLDYLRNITFVDPPAPLSPASAAGSAPRP